MAASKIPVWIKQCLDQYGNCACGRAITKKIGKDNLICKIKTTYNITSIKQ